MDHQNLKFQQGTSTNGIRNPLRIKTRLARRLQTGDSLVIILKE